MTPHPIVRVYTLNLGVLGEDGRAPIERAGRAALSALSVDEWNRAKLIRSAGRRKEFLLTRGVLRLLLGEAVGSAPQALVFAFGAHGKPYLPEHRDLYFNVSHTTGRALIAMTLAGPVGVDVERLDSRLAWEPIADQVFSAPTRRAIGAVPSDRRIDTFLQCWTRGEAVLKATGEGLAGVEHGLDIPVGDCTQGHAGLAARGLQLQDLPSGGKYAAAVALGGAADASLFVVIDEPVPHPARLMGPTRPPGRTESWRASCLQAWCTGF